mgnify:FL=1
MENKYSPLGYEDMLERIKKQKYQEMLERLSSTNDPTYGAEQSVSPLERGPTQKFGDLIGKGLYKLPYVFEDERSAMASGQDLANIASFTPGPGNILGALEGAKLTREGQPFLGTLITGASSILPVSGKSASKVGINLGKGTNPPPTTSKYNVSQNTSNVGTSGDSVNIVSLADEAIANTPGFANPEKTYQVKNLIETYSKYGGKDGNPNKFVARELKQALDNPDSNKFTINGKERVTAAEFREAYDNNRLEFIENHSIYNKVTDDFGFNPKYDFSDIEPEALTIPEAYENSRGVKIRIEDSSPLRANNEEVYESGEFTIQAFTKKGNRGTEENPIFTTDPDEIHGTVGMGSKANKLGMDDIPDTTKNRINHARYNIVEKDGVTVFELSELQSPYMFNQKINIRDKFTGDVLPTNIDDAINLQNARIDEIFEETFGMKVRGSTIFNQFKKELLKRVGTNSRSLTDEAFLGHDEIEKILEETIDALPNNKGSRTINNKLATESMKRNSFVNQVNDLLVDLRKTHRDSGAGANASQLPLAKDNRHFDLGIRRGLQLSHENNVQAFDLPINDQAIYRQMVGDLLPETSQATIQRNIKSLNAAGNLGESYKRAFEKSIKRINEDYGTNINYTVYKNDLGQEFARIILNDDTAKIRQVLKYNQGGVASLMPLKYDL